MKNGRFKFWVGVFDEHKKFLKIGVLSSFLFLFENKLHIWVPNVMGKIFHQKIPDFDKVFWNEIFDRFTLFLQIRLL